MNQSLPLRTSAVLLIALALFALAAVALLSLTNGPAQAQEQEPERREGYEERLAARIARYEAAKTADGVSGASSGLISELASTITRGGSDSFTVSADALDDDRNYGYSISLRSSARGLGFNSSCSYRSEIVRGSRTSETMSGDATAYGCIDGTYTITAQLIEYAYDEDEDYILETDSQRVRVGGTPPTNTPTPTPTPTPTATPTHTPTPTPTPRPLPRPLAPAGFDVDPLGNDTAIVSWNSRSGIARTEVWYRTLRGTWSRAGSSTWNDHVENNLTCNTTYAFRARAWGDGRTYAQRWSYWTNTATMRTGACDPTPTPTPTPTHTPTPTPTPTPIPPSGGNNPTVPNTPGSVTSDGCLTNIGTTTGSSSGTGEWKSGCDSTNRANRYAHYYQFTLSAPHTMTIDLSSDDTDTYLLLLSGAGKNGSVLDRNDDVGSAGARRTDSRLTRVLAAGTYTVEATTYGSSAVGDFTLSLDATLTPPFSVNITANKQFPASGDQIILQADVTNPPGGQATYQWEEKGDADRWTDWSSGQSTFANSSVSAVRTFRVTVKYGTKVVTDTYSIIWDEGKIVDAMVKSLVNLVTPDVQGAAAVHESATSYSIVERAFRECIGESTYPSLGSAMAAYGTNKAAVDRCDQSNNTFWDAHRAFKQGLGGLTNPLHKRLLGTEQGEEFSKNIANPDSAKRTASLIAALLPSGVTGQVGPGGDVALTTGVDCMGDLTNTATESQRFEALNCLAFRTPHSFWVGMQEGENVQKNRTDFMKAFCNTTNPVWGKDCADRKYNWIHYGNLECSVPDSWWYGPVNFGFRLFKSSLQLAPCLKHDLVWNALQGIEGGNTTTAEEEEGKPADDDSMDKAWGPRNKYLSDAQFLIDHLCEERVNGERDACIRNNADYWYRVAVWDYLVSRTEAEIDALTLAEQKALAATWGVADWSDFNWPITVQDVEHAKTNVRYMVCDYPHVEISSISKTGKVRWTAEDGCVDDMTIDEYEWCWKYDIHVGFGWWSGREVCGPEADFPRSTSNRRDITLDRVIIKPDDVIYGGAGYIQYLYRELPK